MYKHWITVLLLLWSIAVHAQNKFNPSKISKATGKIVAKMEKIHMVMGSGVSFSGDRPKQYDYFMSLKKKATLEELLTLTDHPSGVIRCYAFWALSYDPAADLFPIVADHINDDESVETLFGCIGGSEKVGDFFIEVATPQYVDLQARKLDAAQLLALDSILIYRSNDSYARTNAIKRLPPVESMYAKIRDLAIQEHDQAAVVTLAKYQKPQDVTPIMKNRSVNEEEGYASTYQAIIQFPHPDFLPFLEQNLLKTLDDTTCRSEWMGLYKAIAGYKNEQAVELLKIPFAQVKDRAIRKCHIGDVFAALKTSTDAVYEDLLWKLWMDEARINLDVFNHLADKDPQKAFELSKRSLLAANGSEYAVITYGSTEFDNSKKLLATMLHLAIKKDPVFGIEIIRQNIPTANVHIFPIFVDGIAVLPDKSFINPLFDRLETEDNPYIYLKAAATLIAYHDPAINKRIIAAIHKNKHLTEDWGGKEFKKLLKENNLR